MTSFDKLKQRWVDEAKRRSERADVAKRRLLQRGVPLFKKYDIGAAYLFGSVAAGRCTDRSDVDLYVSGLPNHRYWIFRHELEETVQLPIDLYSDSDDPRFVKKIVERGEKIYGV
jgi:uncharacterized protein